MKNYLLILVLFLSGCSTTVPVTAKFPTLPEELNVMCPPLKQIPNDAKLSDITKTILDNYQLYHICSTNNDTLLEWITTQKKIFEEVQ